MRGTQHGSTRPTGSPGFRTSPSITSRGWCSVGRGPRRREAHSAHGIATSSIVTALPTRGCKIRSLERREDRGRPRPEGDGTGLTPIEGFPYSPSRATCESLQRIQPQTVRRVDRRPLLVLPRDPAALSRLLAGGPPTWRSGRLSASAGRRTPRRRRGHTSGSAHATVQGDSLSRQGPPEPSAAWRHPPSPTRPRRSGARSVRSMARDATRNAPLSHLRRLPLRHSDAMPVEHRITLSRRCHVTSPRGHVITASGDHRLAKSPTHQVISSPGGVIAG